METIWLSYTPTETGGIHCWRGTAGSARSVTCATLYIACPTPLDKEDSVYNAYRNGIALSIATLGSALALSACNEVELEAPGEEDDVLVEAPEAVQGTCHWQGATVKQGAWHECAHCQWRYCQCQPNGMWGNCTNQPPPGGACDWTKPDWTNPACSGGGSKPCDWTNPDWTNPSCQNTPPPGGGQACTSCHPGGPPSGTPPPHIHTWL